MRDQAQTGLWNNKISKKSAVASRKELAESLGAGQGHGMMETTSTVKSCETCNRHHAIEGAGSLRNHR